MAVFNIISLNVRGLGDTNKRRSIFDEYRKRCHILCLQETHVTEKVEKLWETEWGGKIVSSFGTSAARGVCILVKRDVQVTITNVHRDVDGRYLKCRVNTTEGHFTLVNLYGPNKDSANFFEEKFNTCKEDCDRLIITGDFNTALEKEVDRSEKFKINNDQAARKIKEKMVEMELKDVWRERNEDKRRYSWYRTKPHLVASRLDYALISTGLCASIHDIFYLAGIKTDHSAFFLGIEMRNIERGSSYWKFNVSLLSNIEFVKEANSVLINTAKSTQGVQPMERWELVKQAFKEKAQQFSRKHASENKIEMSQLMEFICEQENQLETLNADQLDVLMKSCEELNDLVSIKTRGILFRSKMKWYMEGEKNTRYFYSLEKAKYGAKTCTTLIDEEGCKITDEKKIVDMQHEFYQQLYKADTTTHFQMENTVKIKLKVSADTMAASEVQFSIDEVKESVKSLKNNSCPGADGLPIEVYKVFWEQIKEPLYGAIVQSYQQEDIFPSAKRGILNLIPKGNKDPRKLANLRPITLLNSDYKVIEKCIANRMMPALDTIISDDQ